MHPNQAKAIAAKIANKLFRLIGSDAVAAYMVPYDAKGVQRSHRWLLHEVRKLIHRELVAAGKRKSRAKQKRESK